MKYPYVLLLRKNKYSEIDKYIKDNHEKFQCTIKIIDDVKKVKELFKSECHILVTYGETIDEYLTDVLEWTVPRFNKRWFHKKSLKNIEEFNYNVGYCYIDNVIDNRENSRPKFSIFTTCFKSYEKIKRAYGGVKSQSLLDWEWVILDDSPEDKHFNFLKEFFKDDPQIRLYNRSHNSGSIGNVKNEAVSLCRGKYVLELDHDDIILPDCLNDAYEVFESNPEIGFIYMHSAMIYENGENFTYGDFISKGYGGYYTEKISDHWYNIYMAPNINNITLSHLVACPNHPRIWKRETLFKLGNYSEFLPICDDYEIILRTCINCQVAKINKLGYIQFMNNNSNNFSLIRNGEINRIGPDYISKQFYRMYKVDDIMKQKNAYENEEWKDNHSKIWKRIKYQHKYCNLIFNNDVDKQYCLIGIASLDNPRIKELYKNKKNDFIVLDNKCSTLDLQNILEMKDYERMKCYCMNDCSELELKNYFNFLYKYNDNFEIIQSSNVFDIDLTRANVINNYSSNDGNYLEIGVEYGTTFKSVKIKNKTGVDPDPKYEDDRIIKKTSDEFFKTNNKKFDYIFIDGMHQSDYMLRDFINSLNVLNFGGTLFVDDILPETEKEQKKFPEKHHYENSILKYSEPGWTGDVWKVIYYIIKNFESFITLNVSNYISYRGVGVFQILKPFKIHNIDVALKIIESYDYKNDFEKYKEKLIKLHNKTEIPHSLYSLNLSKLKNYFLNETPFNYLVLDNMINSSFLKLAENNIRNYSEKVWTHAIIGGMPEVQVNKFYIPNKNLYDKISKMIYKFFNSRKLVEWLSKLTGIENLQSDPSNSGGGIHRIKKNGLLHIHSDFNRHSETKKYRRVNILLYLNSDWDETCGGELELWKKDMTACVRKIPPLFNRIVIMRITDDANNGHPETWEGDSDRLSFAFYYYTDDRPDNEKSEIYHAQWKKQIIIL